MHEPYVIACTGPYLSLIGLDQRDKSIFGIRRTGLTFLSAYFILSMQTCVHARYVLACLGPYLSQIGLDQKDEGI